ncbi:AAEL008825-PA [Aedes aegypti]|uniref:AAEL008825-PA n=1 Tax=Aedes aegypti TaxID=7159 RepID=Q16XM8_AEDAE|nr:AAEL008825-PA [Aedes aegypti]
MYHHTNFSTEIPIGLVRQTRIAIARPLILPSPPPVGNSNLSSNGIEKLVDLHFGPLYPDYADHTRPVLIRQARDLLVCTFHGDLERFEAGFLRPAASIVGELKSSYLQGQVSQLLWVLAE